MRKLNLFTYIPLILFLCVSCGGNRGAEQQVAGAERTPLKGGQASVKDDLSARNIVQIAAASKDHTTLVAAVQAAGMADVLANPGPLTVFAPNNAAFEKLPEGTVDNLLKPENKKTLMRIITHHATPGTYKESDLKDGLVLGQATGVNIKIEKKEDAYYVEGAKILGTVEASNGIVHVVDAVLLPPE
ncbi:MAG: fasciclin domain-containing protein [Cytophagales bacterium]|nr:fasciclin domain-containing protein [Cytophagales bacterium]